MSDPGRDLSEIRSMMEKSSKILSLSGRAGIVIGSFALAGVLFAQYALSSAPQERLQTYLLSDAILVLVTAIIVVVVFSSRMAKRKGLPIWNASAKHLVTELAIPLGTGGVLCIAQLIQESYSFLPSTMLIFYGLALFTASKYTIIEVRVLGLVQLTIGILAAFFDGQALNLWALGFGIGHIVFGARVYLKYER